MSPRIDTNLPLLRGAIRRFRLQEVAGSSPAKLHHRNVLEIAVLRPVHTPRRFCVQFGAEQ
jgi:hypothetical protein